MPGAIPTTIGYLYIEGQMAEPRLATELVASSLLATKLYIPPIPSRWISRPHLVERLNDSLRAGHRLILVSAPAGFGKTTLVSEWVANLRLDAGPNGLSVGAHDRSVGAHGRAPPQAAWLSLDEGDNDPTRFWSYLVAALQSVHAGVGQEALSAWQSPAAAAPPVDAMLVPLINELAALPGPCVLILDDLHTVTAETVHEALFFLIDHLPPRMHVAVLTRVDPPWPVARLRARQQMTELRTEDLRFTQDQVTNLVNDVMGLDLSPQDVRLLDARTEGWIAGLQMASLALDVRPFGDRLSDDGLSPNGRPDASAFVQALSGSHRFVLDYLVEEVLDRQSGEVQDFLLKTSILDRLSAPLCDAILGNCESEATLNWLERANLFLVPLDGERRWYRYHRLFADLLQSRLQRTAPDEVPVLRQRASLWCEENGLQAEAVDHALAAGDVERVADLVERNAEGTLMRGEVATLKRWIDALPEKVVRARPSLCFYAAWTLVWQGRSLKTIESLLRDASPQDASPQDAGKGGQPVAARVTAMRALLAGFRGQAVLAADLARRALEQLPAGEQFMRTLATWILRSIQSASEAADSQVLDEVFAASQRAGNVMLAFWIACNRAELHMRQGRLHQAHVTYRQALDMASDARGGRLPIAGAALTGLGEISREWNDLESAAQYLLEGIRLSEQWTDVGPLEAYICLARVRWAQGDAKGAQSAIDRAQELAVRFDLTDLDDLTVAMVRAWLHVAQGDLASARRWAEERNLFRYIDAPLREEAGDRYDHRMVKYELLVLARLLIAQGRPAEALQVLEPLEPIAERRGRPGILIESHALQALAWRAQGDLDQALSALQRALSLAEPEGYARILLDEGEPMRALLAAYRSRVAERAGRLHTYVDKLLATHAPDHGGTHARDVPPMVEPLTERERQVLVLLRTPLSLPEIAERLYISANTVRSHAKHIYAKLDVHSRAEAVERAQELGLL